MFPPKLVFLLTIFSLVTGAVGAQNASFSTGPASTPAEVQARLDSLRTRNYPPATAEGVSVAELAEYAELVERHKPSPDAPFSTWAGLVTATEKDRLLALFRRMSRTQQLAQQVVFVRPEAPKPRTTLSEAEFAAFRDSTHYTVILDFRPLDNSNLAGYKASDFAWYQVAPNLVRRAGSAYFTQRVQLQTVRNYELAQERYEKYKDSYQMVFSNYYLRKTRVQRPAN